MSANRKLLQEMDRVFKRVNEGLAAFTAVYDKLESASTQAAKEKIEQDLKREIKRLQKQRDIIKGWQSSSEIRDKKQLTEYRKLIEVEMEKFKSTEREIKTKAYSREGLQKGERADDPRAQEKREAIDFLQTQMEELETQTETLEDEVDNVQSTMKKGKKDTSKQERIASLDRMIERHKWHISQMDIMIHMIESDTLAPESVMDLQDDILYYVESNQDVDFAEDEAIYDDLNLVANEEEVEALEQLHRDESTYTLEDLAQDLDKDREREERERERRQKEHSLSPSPSAPPLAPAAREPSVEPPAPKEVSNPPRKSVSPPADKPALTPLPPAEKTPKKVKPAPITSTAPTSARSTPQPQTPQPITPIAPQASTATTTTTTPVIPSQPQHTSHPQGPRIPELELPPGLQDLVHCFDAARQRLANPHSSHGGAASIGKLIESSYLNAPDAALADVPRIYHPESPYPTPDYYPAEVLASLEDPELFTKMDLDTLFYVFYYRQGTHQQFLAARELNSRSWRFHKRFQTWFQRHEDPQEIRDEYEMGTYRFFDFEGSWLQRRKTNFKFEYQYLEGGV